MSQPNYVKSSTSSDNYEPFMLGDKQAGEVHWLSQSDSSGHTMYAGLWRCEPMTFEYEFPGDEMIHVLQGRLLIEMASGETVELCAGEIAHFNKGTKSNWTIKESFQKFFVITNC